MALLAPQVVSITGLAPVYSAVAASDTIAPDSGLVLHVKNAGGSIDTATVVVPGSRFGQANPDVAVSVPATTGDRMIKLDSPNELADPTTGLITVTHSFTTSVTCAYVRV